MTDIEERLEAALEERRSRKSLRRLTAETDLVDFCSNDYLGYARSDALQQMIGEEEARQAHRKIGSTGSRLISGNSEYYEGLEKHIAKFHRAETGLIFNSGFDANIGLFSCVPQRNDIILYDQLVHASIRDGIRLSHARAFSFKHNSISDLKRRIASQDAEHKALTGNVFVAVESVYSMDGNFSPLKDLAELCSRHGAGLIVDEAHATGVFGGKGEGRVAELGLENDVFARLHTFGKALGSHGAIVLGSQTLRSYLVNFARPFIYTTALPFHSLAAIRCAYELLAGSDTATVQLRRNISFFKRRVGAEIQKRMIPSDSAIQCVIMPGNEQVRAAAREIQDAGFDVRPIMHPTVPAGSERLRFCLHAFNTEDEIEVLIKKVGAILK